MVEGDIGLVVAVGIDVEAVDRIRVEGVRLAAEFWVRNRTERGFRDRSPETFPAFCQASLEPYGALFLAEFARQRDRHPGG
jgi:hypothetical protein